METNVTHRPPDREPGVTHFAAPGARHTRCGIDRTEIPYTTDDQHLVNCPDCAAAPERRTVSIEVLTDELRGLAEEHKTTARVGVVLRVGGEAVRVPEVDVTWGSRHRQPADVLAALLRQARHYTDEDEKLAVAELLMPTPDVLTALAGTTDATFWTAPITILAEHVQAGWRLVGEVDGTGETTEQVAAVADCDDASCHWHEDCKILTVDVHNLGVQPVHFAGWSSLTVRIPADQAATR